MNLEDCQYKNTCVCYDYCYNSCIMKNIYEVVTEKTPEYAKKEYSGFLESLAKGKNIFLTAAGGCGKSFLTNQLDKYLGNAITMTATTGVAALNINGSTLHSTLGLGLGKGSVQNLMSKLNSYKLDFLNRIKILAIDEVSMLSGELLDKCNDFLKLARMNNKPFGGIQVILIGDFCQLPPVETESQVKDFCFYSRTWKELDLDCYELKHNFRQQDDCEYAEVLRLLRLGQITQKGFELIQSRIVDNPPDNVPRLYATNNEVYQYNMTKLKELNNEIKTFRASYSSPNENIKKNKEFYNSLVDKLKKSSPNEDELSLCIGARVMLTRNLDITNGLVNGSLGYISDFCDDNSILVDFDNEESRFIKITNTDMHDAEGKILVSQNQYPLRLASAYTIHKSQSSTLDKVFIDFNKFFEVNQAYVALSRVKSSKGLFVKNFSNQSIRFSPEVLDFYKSLEVK